MAIAIGVWSLELTPGKPVNFAPEADIRITNVCLGEKLKDESGRSVVKFSYQTPAGALDDEGDEDDDEPTLVTKSTILCALKAGTFEQTTTDIILQEDDLYTFEVVGKNTVHLTGNYLDQGGNNPPPTFMDSDDEEMDSDDEEEAYDLRDVSSDVEMHPDDLVGIESDASRFEEVVEEPPKQVKRPRESETEPEKDASKSKADKKKKKKQKGESGQAIDVTPEENKKEEKNEKNEKEKKEKKPKLIEKDLAGGIKLLDAKVGDGPMAKKGSTVKMRYIGKLQNGKIFDKNISGKPFTFHLGKGEVIKGWDEGIVGMQAGGERKLTIPPAMAYGNKSMEGIPKNSTLIFEVKLLEIR